MQKFPNHFHEYYVLGFIEKGKRHLSCKNMNHIIEPGDLTLFTPHENHACEQVDGRTLNYRCINIQPAIMRGAVFEITGKEFLSEFTDPVIFHSELVPLLWELHRMIMQTKKDFKREELFFSWWNNFLKNKLNKIYHRKKTRNVRLSEKLLNIWKRFESLEPRISSYNILKFKGVLCFMKCSAEKCVVIIDSGLPTEVL